MLDTGYVGSKATHQFSRPVVNNIDPATAKRPLEGYGQIEAKENHGNGSFHGWQSSLQRRFRSGFQFAANYLWSHAINDGSVGNGEAIYPKNVACRRCERSSSDEDIRHVFNTNMVYELPFGKRTPLPE